jgi:hypothetical protein
MVNLEEMNADPLSKVRMEELGIFAFLSLCPLSWLVGGNCSRDCQSWILLRTLSVLRSFVLQLPFRLPPDSPAVASPPLLGTLVPPLRSSNGRLSFYPLFTTCSSVLSVLYPSCSSCDFPSYRRLLIPTRHSSDDCYLPFVVLASPFLRRNSHPLLYNS